MICQDCGGLVTWRGPLTNLTHTECEGCGAMNSQIPEGVPVTCGRCGEDNINDSHECPPPLPPTPHQGASDE